VKRQLFLKVPGQHAVAFAAALFLVSLSSAAQVFPVQANVSLTPPYSPYLSDYTAPGSQRLIIQLMPNDITTSDHPIKLRITIEGVGITIRTKQNFVPQPLTLYGGGSPTILYGEDIVEYFNPNNLEFAGYSQAEFLKTAKIPEGIYRFSVEVFSYNRNVQLSNKGTTMAWIILNDPPLLNLPRKDTKIKILDPTSIPFTWTPRHTGSPNSAFSTEYIFRLVEIWPENRNPNDAFLTQRPLYEETTTQTQFVYGLEHPALIPGRKYAWSVQARDVEGKDLFKNQGKSEVFVFQFGDALSAPENITQDRSNARTIDISWEPPAQGEIPKSYRIRYRKKGTANRSPWYESITDQRWITLTELQSDTTYEMQIRSESKPLVSEYSQLQYIHTKADTTLPFTCGKDTDILMPENSNPLLILKPGDVITAANFKVTVTEAEPSGETFSGKGYMAVPFFNMATIKVAFTGIRLNDKYQLTGGEIITTYTKDSPITRKIDEAHKIGEQNVDATDSATLAVMIPGEIDTVYFDTEKSEVVVIDTEGNTSTHQQPVDKKTDGPAAMQITDSVGNKYTVTPDGRVIKEGSSSSLASRNANPNLVNFKQDADQHYGFDELVYDAHAAKYEKERINGVESFIAWKSVSSGGTDNVLAWSDKMKNFFDDVSYKSPNGDIAKRKTENDVQLTVTSPAHEEVIEVQANIKDPNDTTKTLIIGRLNVIGYDPIVKNLVLVPVNGAPIPSDASLAQELNKIFSPAIVTWNIRAEKEGISVGLGDDGKLDDGSSGLLSNYTQEMRDVIRAFKDKKDIEDETYYLFFVKEGELGSKAGYMPRKRQCGFIFTSKVTSQNLSKTVAHELAHGAFRLEHTFATYPSLSEGSTDNLMDYSTGTRLHKYQWDLIHNPVSVWGLFEGDEAGASFCTWWHQSIISGINPSLKDKKIKEFEPLFEHVAANFTRYYDLIRGNNINPDGFESWSIRKSSLNKSKKTNLVPVESIFKKLVDGKTDEFNGHEYGIFLGTYTIENQDFNVAVYSPQAKFSVEKVQVDNLCDLVGHQIISITIEDNYTIISFFKADELKMIVQINSGEDDAAKLWLTYLGILVEGPSLVDKVKAYWNSLWDKESDAEEDSYYGDIVDNPQIAPTSIASYQADNFKGGIYGCIRKVKKQNGQTALCGNAFEVVGNDTLYIKHHNGLDIYALPGTELKAIIDGTVTFETSTTLAGNKVKLSGKSKEGKQLLYVYCHVEMMPDGLENGDAVKKGDIIAIAGATGNAANVDFKHCHLTIYVDGVECTSPSDFIKTKFDSNGKPDHGLEGGLIATSNNN
jgi:murein DD-endopeptidase MepM/ murein hydrolase activator NlpD